MVEIDYFDFIRSYMAGNLNGLYFLHLDDGCRTSYFKLIDIETGTVPWGVVRVDPSREGISVGFIMQHFKDIPAHIYFKNGVLIRLLDSVAFPSAVRRLEELYEKDKLETT